ncbi:MAG: PilZ domain-containing protein [Butyrivibrio sp.]|nr:PilZ domain-containing protein [Butyrivibrio sp.]
MKVSEIGNGSEVKIYAAVKGHSIVLMTEAVFGVAAGLLVNPMEYFGKYIQFLEPSIVQIRNKRDGRVYKFMSTTITPVKTRYGNYHLIRCSSTLEPENSRRAERFNIEKLGLISVNGNKMDLRNCIVHDISMRGISLVMEDGTTCIPGDKIDVMFRYGATLHNYELKTVVVRNFKVGRKNAVGCSIENLNVDLIGLLTAKKEEMRSEMENNNAKEETLNPQIPKEQQLRELEEDVANKKDSQRLRTITIRSGEPLIPKNLEHPLRDVRDNRTFRQRNKEKKFAEQARRIENLLDLRNL